MDKQTSKRKIKTTLILEKHRQKIEYIFKKLKDKGFKTYLVGGSVRDMLLGLTPNDFDIVTNAPIEQVEKIFKEDNAKRVGKSFNICIVNKIEISSCRSEKQDYQFPLDDLKKRDFSINAMAYDPFTKEVIDFFEGKKDLEKRIIRFTKDSEKRIIEDPLRMVRALRFVARFNGQLSLSSSDAITANKLLIKNVATERIQKEIKKAMRYKSPSIFFKGLQTTGLLAYIFPSLARCFDLDGGPHHGETVFEHCMLVGDALSPKRPLLRLAGFLHDTGKFDAAIVKEGKLKFFGHEKYADSVMKDLDNLKFSVQEKDYISSLLKVHMRPLTVDTTPKAARKLLVILEREGLSYRDFLRLRIADMRGNLARKPYTISQIRDRLGKLTSQIEQGNAFSVKDLRISGKDVIQILGISAGPKVGEILDLLFEKVINEPDLNSRSNLEKELLKLKDVQI